MEPLPSLPVVVFQEVAEALAALDVSRPAVRSELSERGEEMIAEGRPDRHKELDHESVAKVLVALPTQPLDCRAPSPRMRESTGGNRPEIRFKDLMIRDLAEH